jgi:hypothetical protein
VDRRNVTVRKGRLGETDEPWEARLREAVSPDDRFAEAWLLSEEIWLLKGWNPDESGLSRSVVRVVRR